MQQLKYIQSAYHHDFLNLFLLSYFLTIQEKLYMMHLYLDLFYEAFNTIDQYHYKKYYFL